MFRCIMNRIMSTNLDVIGIRTVFYDADLVSNTRIFVAFSYFIFSLIYSCPLIHNFKWLFSPLFISIINISKSWIFGQQSTPFVGDYSYVFNTNFAVAILLRGIQPRERLKKHFTRYKLTTHSYKVFPLLA